MNDKNPQALALAYKKATGKIRKIKELGITPDMKEKDIEELIDKLATAKAVEKETDITEVVAGQRWYVESLVRFSGLTPEQQLQFEYDDAFADTASESEMLRAMQQLTEAA